MNTRALFRGPAHVMMSSTDPRFDGCLGCPAREAFPDHAYLEAHRAMDRVYRTGRPEIVDITRTDDVMGTSLMVRILDDDGQPWGVAAEFEVVAAPPRPRLRELLYRLPSAGAVVLALLHLGVVLAP